MVYISVFVLHLIKILEEEMLNFGQFLVTQIQCMDKFSFLEVWNPSENQTH